MNSFRAFSSLAWCSVSLVTLVLKVERAHVEVFQGLLLGLRLCCDRVIDGALPCKPQSFLRQDRPGTALAFFLAFWRSWRPWRSLHLGCRGAFAVFFVAARKVVVSVVWGETAVWGGTIRHGSPVSALASSLVHLAVSIWWFLSRSSVSAFF